MKTYNIFTNQPQTLPRGQADFLLAASVTKTCEIAGITQAGIPGMIPLTPTLDAEFISTQKVFSLGELAETPTGIPTPALITRAVHNLIPFSSIEILDLGLQTQPQNCTLIDFGISPSNSIKTGADIDAKALFEKGRAFAKSYQPKGDYLILGESTPSGTTTATSSALALGYECKDAFSSSFLEVPNSIREETINSALSHIDEHMSNFEKLGSASDNMLLFVAGVISEAKFPLVLAGGTQMAAALLIADRLNINSIEGSNITLATTAWVAKDKNSDIKKLLELLSFKITALYTEFSFVNADIPVLKKYDEGEAREGVGAGAALAYAVVNDIDNDAVLTEIQSIMMGML